MSSVAIPSVSGLSSVPDLIDHWTFVESAHWHLWPRRTFFRLTKEQAAPPYQVLVPVEPRKEWIAYFAYLPDGQLTAAHRFTLERFRELKVPLLVVCAAREPSLVPRELYASCDALCWKGTSGYDFSAYAVALRLIAERSPGAKAFVINDSVFGPFADLRRFLVAPPWDLTGLTAQSAMENHVQSYAFILRDITPARLAQLAPAIPLDRAYDDIASVITQQETTFARVASRSMTVGAHWFGDLDGPLFRAVELLQAGFPFVKKSLIGKHQQLNDPVAIRKELDRLGHP